MMMVMVMDHEVKQTNDHGVKSQDDFLKVQNLTRSRTTYTSVEPKKLLFGSAEDFGSCSSAGLI
jgi:hypothetical protein